MILLPHLQIPDTGNLKCPTNPDDLFARFAAIFLFVPCTVIFFTTLNTVVYEKEVKLKDGMEMIGLLPSVYWIAHFTSIGLVVAVNSFLTVIFGLIFQFPLFLNGDLGVGDCGLFNKLLRRFCSSCFCLLDWPRSPKHSSWPAWCVR